MLDRILKLKNEQEYGWRRSSYRRREEKVPEMEKPCGKSAGGGKPDALWES